MWLIVSIALVTRFYELDRVPGVQGDEAWYGVQALDLLHGRGGELRTPTGNVPGLLHGGALVLLHSLFPPSLWLLRLPALISSLAAMAGAYAIGRRFFGPVAGMTALVLMACLPINLAYARFGWDPSQLPLLILLATYCALAGRRLLAALLFAFAISNHPSAVFAGPFLLLAYLGVQRDRLPLREALFRTALLAAVLAAAILLALMLSAGAGSYLDASKSLVRLLDPFLWGQFGMGFARLLSGDTIYRYVVGEGYGGTGPWIDLATVLVLVATLVAGLVLAIRKFDWTVAGLVAGWVASLAGLYIVAGLWTLQPGLERFGFALVPVTVLAIAAVVGRHVEVERVRPLFQPLLAAVAIPLLAGFWLCYLRPLDSGEARPKPGSWTGPVDPNRLAVETIARAAARSARNVRVIAEDWWIYWPAAYYAEGKPLKIVNADRRVPPVDSESFRSGTYWIAYGGGPLGQALAQREMDARRWKVATSNRHNYLQIWWTPPPQAKAR